MGYARNGAVSGSATQFNLSSLSVYLTLPNIKRKEDII